MITDKNITMLKFGTGDIAVVSLDDTVYFAENNQYFDVSQVEGEKAIELVKNHTKVMMTFDDVHGIDIVIEALKKVKKHLSR